MLFPTSKQTLKTLKNFKKVGQTQLHTAEGKSNTQYNSAVYKNNIRQAI